MSWSFNPFTGNLDLTGSSGAVVFEGEVETFADLPEVVGDPPVGSSYLVRTSTGVWLVNRRQAGIWIRRNNTGVRATDWEYGGDYPVNSVNGQTGNVSLSKSDVGLGNVDNTSDINKPISTATQTALDGKAASVHTHTASEISNSTVTGRSILTAATSTSVRTFIQAAAAIHNHASTDITGLGDLATQNAATPPAIGSTTPAAGSFTNLSASAELQLPTNAPASPSAGDLYRVSDTLRYRDGTNAERLLLNATDNLANLANTATARTNLGLGSAAVSASTDFAAASHNHAASAITSGVFDNARINFAAPDAIGSTTRNTGAFTTLNATNGTLTASAPALTVSQTWNNSGVTFSALDINVTNTASLGDSALIKATIGGTTVFQFRRDYRLLLSPSGSDALIQAGGVDWIVGRYNGTTSIAAPTIRFNTGNSTILEVGTADTIEMRRTTNAQTFRLYNTFTDASNYERGFMRWSSNVLQIGTEKLGTGSARALEFQTDGTTRMTLASSGGIYLGAKTWTNTPSIQFEGGANRAGIFVYEASLECSSSSTTMRGGPNATDWIRMSSGRLMFSGTTSSFPALKRSSTALQVRLADDSAFAPLECASLTLTGGTVTASAPVIDVTQTWNNAAVTFTGLRLNATNTASASGSLLMDLQTGGTSQFSVRRDGRVNCNSITVGGVSTMDTGAGQLLIRNAVLGWDNNAVMIQNTDLQLFRDAADTLAQRRTTNPQTFRIYNTVSGTGNVNFERANFRWASNEFIIDAEAGGTGTLRGIKIGSATASLLGFYGATPVDRPDTVSDAATQDLTGSDTLDKTKVEADLTSCKTAINAVIDRLQELGLIA